MKKLILSAMVIASLGLLLPSSVEANSVTFQISATIPEIPGVNVPPFDNPAQFEAEQKHHKLETVREEIWRGSQKIQIVTVTEK